MILLSQGNQYKSVDPKLGVGFWHSGAVGDLNNDGLADFLAVTPGKGLNTIAIQRRDGSFIVSALSLDSRQTKKESWQVKLLMSTKMEIVTL